MKTESNDKKVYNSPEIKDLGKIGQVTATGAGTNQVTADTSGGFHYVS